MPAAASTVNVTFRMDRAVKEQADALFRSLGLNLSTVWNMFVSQSLREKGLPFTPSLDTPNKTTFEAAEEAFTELDL